jgi:hypothetical protein
MKIGEKKRNYIHIHINHQKYLKHEKNSIKLMEYTFIIAIIIQFNIDM